MIAWLPCGLIVHHLFSELGGNGFETLAELGFTRAGINGCSLLVAWCRCGRVLGCLVGVIDSGTGQYGCETCVADFDPAFDRSNFGSFLLCLEWFDVLLGGLHSGRFPCERILVGCFGCLAVFAVRYFFKLDPASGKSQNRADLSLKLLVVPV